MGLRRIGTSLKTLGKKHAPEIELVVGLFCIGTSLWFTRKAAQKELEIRKEHEAKLAEVKEKYLEKEEPLTEEEQKEQTSKIGDVYVKTTIKMVKNYGPAVGTAFLGLGCICLSHKTLKKREVAAVLMAEKLRQAWGEYRNRVREEIGAEKEQAVYLGGKKEKITVVDEEGVVEEVEATTLPNDSAIPYGPYSVEMNRFSKEWSKSPSQLMTRLRSKEAIWTKKLNTDGRVFLYDVICDLDLLDLYDPEVIPYLQRVGWVDKNGFGKGFVSFDLANAWRHCPDHPEKGYEFYPVLDFNVDGDLFELNKTHKLGLFGFKRNRR